MDGTTLGVEEEFQIVDRVSGELVPRSDELVPLVRERLGEQVTAELNRCQIETATDIHDGLAGLRSELSRAPPRARQRGGGDRLCGPARRHPSLELVARPGRGGRAGPLPGDGGPLPAPRPPAGHLRLPRARGHRRSRTSSVAVMTRARPVAPRAARPRGQLPVLERRGHRLRQLPARGLGPLAHRGIPPSLDDRAAYDERRRAAADRRRPSRTPPTSTGTSAPPTATRRWSSGPPTSA